MANLERFGRLGSDEVEAIEQISNEARRFEAGQTIVTEGSEQDFICLIKSGVAVRYKRLSSVKRQIFGYTIPGDICDVNLLVFNQPDHSLAALSDCSVVTIPITHMKRTMQQFSMIQHALSHAASVDSAILREWLSNVAQRNAYQRLSHFFCEMLARLQAVGLAEADGLLELKINQAALADTMGLTPVHISRTLQRLRKERLIDLRRHHLVIVDRHRLAQIAGFDAKYLAASPTYDCGR